MQAFGASSQCGYFECRGKSASGSMCDKVSGVLPSDRFSGPGTNAEFRPSAAAALHVGLPDIIQAAVAKRFTVQENQGSGRSEAEDVRKLLCTY